MYEYTMTIDGLNYKALFTDHFEASDFLDANDCDGAEVVVLGYKEVSVQDIITSQDFEWAYKIEMLASMLLENATDFPKWEMQEQELKRLGFLS